MEGDECFDNIFIERLWRSVKHEEVYLKDYKTIREAVDGLRRYFDFYNYERLHQSLEYRTPATLYFSERKTGKGEVVNTIEMTGKTSREQERRNARRMSRKTPFRSAPFRFPAHQIIKRYFT